MCLFWFKQFFVCKVCKMCFVSLISQVILQGKIKTVFTHTYLIHLQLQCYFILFYCTTVSLFKLTFTSRPIASLLKGVVLFSEKVDIFCSYSPHARFKHCILTLIFAGSSCRMVIITTLFEALKHFLQLCQSAHHTILLQIIYLQIC